MQCLDVLFFYIFSCSVVLVYGIGLEKSFFDSRPGSRFIPRIPVLLTEIIVSVFLVYLLNTHVLQKYGMWLLAPMSTILVCSFIQMLVSLLSRADVRDVTIGERIFFFGTVFLSVSEGTSLSGSIIIAGASIIAFFGVTVLLFSIRERIAASNVHVDWKGAPLILASMGLLSIVMYSADVSWWISEVFR